MLLIKSSIWVCLMIHNCLCVLFSFRNFREAYQIDTFLWRPRFCVLVGVTYDVNLYQAMPVNLPACINYPGRFLWKCTKYPIDSNECINIAFNSIYFCCSHLDNKDKQELSTGGYFCPQCRAKYCELPVECRACGEYMIMKRVHFRMGRGGLIFWVLKWNEYFISNMK